MEKPIMERLSPQSMLNAIGLNGPKDSSPTPQRGSTTSVGLTNADLTKARAWLAEKTPAQVDAAIHHSLTSTLGVSVSVQREWRYPEDGKPYQIATTAGISAPSKEAVQAAIVKLEAMVTPPSHEEAELMISQLQQALARRSSSDDASEIGLDVYVQCLRRHPLDVAKAVIWQLANEPRKDNHPAWFPTLPELEGECRKLSGDRFSTLEGLRGWTEKPAWRVEIERLESRWKHLRQKAIEAGNKVGPGPAHDTGPRGERIAAHDAALREAEEARKEWQASLR